MTRRRPRLLMLLPAGACALLLGLASAGPGPALVARGTVFHDRNRNGARDAGEEGLPGVRVSNGREVVATDGEGRYSLPADSNDELFVIKPRGWMVPVDGDQLPQFFYVHRPEGSPPSRFPGLPPTGPLPGAVDFPLHPQEEPDTFQALFFGDTQPRNQEEVDFIAHDVVEGLIGFEGAFGVTLGDIVFDDLSMFEPLNRVIGQVGIPWFNVIGNHDSNRTSDDRWANETYHRVYGPANFSFDWGPVHFVALDNVFWYHRTGPDGGEGPAYRGRLGDEILEFIRNDLRFVPRETLLVFLMHIPVTSMQDKQEFFRLFEDRPYSLSVSAHMHTQSHHFLGPEAGWNGPEPHHHVINVTVCGSWYSGARDEAGIPHATMSDGAPNGWSVFTFDGHDYTIDFHAARRPAGHQMTIHAPEAVPSDRSAATLLYANVFGGSERSTVEMRVLPGPWRALERIETHDPAFVELRRREEAGGWPGREMPQPSTCRHLWAGYLPGDLEPGLRHIEVRTTDMFGRTFTDQRLIRVLPAIEAASGRR